MADIEAKEPVAANDHEPASEQAEDDGVGVNHDAVFRHL